MEANMEANKGDLKTVSLTLTTVAFDAVALEPHQKFEQARPQQKPNFDMPRPALTRCLVVGAGTVGRTLAESLKATGRFEVVGFVDDQPPVARPPFGGLRSQGDTPGHPDILGSRDELENLTERYGVEEIFIAYAPTWQQQIAEEMATKHPEVRVKMVPTSYESLMRTHHVESYGDIALVSLGMTGKSVRDWLKRFSDIMFAFAILLLSLPISLIAALLVKATSPGPILFTQERVGQSDKPFRMYKFRTMVQDAESATGPVLSVGKSDQRMTPIGRWLRLFRVDEIPQLLNVAKGDMSMVGPRPERTCFVREFERTIPFYGKRHDVRPGITGLAQVHGGYHTTAQDKLRFDLIYVSHYSFWFDVSVLLRTLIVCCLPERHKFEAKVEAKEAARAQV